DFAFHSAAMDPLRDGLLADLSGLSSGTPHALLVSAVTSDQVQPGQLDGEYWWRNIRSPVRFADGMAALVAAGFRIFVEIGPHPVLQPYLHDALRAVGGQGRVLATLTRRQGGDDPFPGIAARCHVAGCDITGGERFDGSVELGGLPLYVWQKEHFWFGRTVEDAHSMDPPFDHPLLGFRQGGPVPSWLNHLDPDVLPWLADHAVEGVPVLPAAAVLEMALAAALLRRPEAGAVEVLDVELRRRVTLGGGRAGEIGPLVSGGEGEGELRRPLRRSDEPLTLHAVARLVTAGEREPPPRLAGPAAIEGVVDADTLYQRAAQLGLDYGPRLCTLRRVALLGRGDARAHLRPSVVRGVRACHPVSPA